MRSNSGCVRGTFNGIEGLLKSPRLFYVGVCVVWIWVEAEELD